METPTISERLGGTKVLGRDIFSDFDWIEAIENGFPHAAVDAAIDAGLLTREESEELVIPRRTLHHRKQKKQRLTLEESDRLLRIARVSVQAEEVFANAEKAYRWLRKPSRPLKGAVPLDLLKTGTGATLVEDELGRIAHGIYV
jgi:putative toxin-antitoxin system antitoxin component (TIGR02293 family)